MSFSPKSLCVFCGSRFGKDPIFKNMAFELGNRLAKEKIQLVYGGGSIGLMGEVAQTTMDQGGSVIGVIPEFLQKYEVGNPNLTELIVTQNMHDRKRTMFEKSDGIIVLPGGLGTLDETFEVLTWKQLRLHNKPVFLLNPNDYWDAFIKLVDQTIEQEFAHEKVRDLYCAVSSIDELFAKFNDIPEIDDAVLTSHF
jgi:uncharacterized protein (TIGR00730 family)